MIVVGLSHRSAPIEVRERVALSGEALAGALAELRAHPDIAEAMVLSTCNRVEVYACGASAEDDGALRAARELFLAHGGPDVMPHLSEVRGRAALVHLFRVACSLDSLVVGEPQILGQLKEAARLAEREGVLGAQLGAPLGQAVRAAKRVRSETAIGAGQVSVPSVAVDLALHIFENVAGHVTLLIGAGEMAETAAKLLAQAGAAILVCNRSADRAADLAAAVGGKTMPWEQLDTALVVADIVVSSTASPHYVVTDKLLRSLRRSRRGRSLFLIDIAVPRDVEPSVNQLDNVYLYDIDDLSHVVAETLSGRADEARRGEQIVADEVARYEQRAKHQAVTPVIVGLRERTRAVLDAELERSLRGKLKHLPEADRAALALMLEAAVNKLLHAPTRKLKDMAEQANGHEYASALCELFELEQAIERQASAAQDEPEIRVAEVAEPDGEALETAEPAVAR